MKSDVKRLVLLAICGLMTLMSILGLFFNVIELSNNGEVESFLNGFKLLSFGQNYFLIDGNEMAIISGILNILILIGSLCAIIMLFIALGNKGRSTYQKTIIIIAMVSSIAYLLEGIIFKSICKNQWTEHGISYVTEYFHTITFVPLIIQSVLLIAYIGCKKYMPNIPTQSCSAPNIEITQIKEQNVPNVENAKSKELHNLKEIATLLKQFKELLDDGVITQEEYDAKKKELL